MSADYLRFCSKEEGSGDEFGEKIADYVRRLAAYHGHLPLLQELLKPLETNDPLTGLLDYEITRAAGESLRHCLLLPCLFRLLTSLSPFFTVRGGQLETLRWLRTQKGFRLNSSFVNFATEGGHDLATMKWLKRNGCPWNESAWFGAAEGGHMEVLRWLRSEDCPWNENACFCAAKGGQLEALKWLRSEGCPWDEEECHAEGKPNIVRWIEAQSSSP